jgi:hypothetical protein
MYGVTIRGQRRQYGLEVLHGKEKLKTWVEGDDRDTVVILANSVIKLMLFRTG